MTFWLKDESGPAHDKQFQVLATVYLNQTGAAQSFLGTGPSIKRAKQHACQNAMEKLSDHQMTGERGTISLAMLRNPNVKLERQLAQCMASIAPDARFHCSVNRFGHAFSAVVTALGYCFPATGDSECAAKAVALQLAIDYAHSVALQCADAVATQGNNRQASPPPLRHCKPESESSSGDFPVATADLLRPDVASCIRSWSRLPTPGDPSAPSCAVSKLLELSSKLKCGVDYECLEKRGSDHDPTFRIFCSFAKKFCTATGEGGSKRAATRDSALRVLTKLCEMITPDSDEPETADGNGCSKLAAQQSSQRRKRNDLKRGKLNADYGRNIHPVTRLYQIQQAKERAEPHFSLKAIPNEDAAEREREFCDQSVASQLFTYEATVSIPDTEPVKAIGRSKRLAKRHAAEAMLRHLGYSILTVRSKPGKSLLKAIPTTAAEDASSNDSPSGEASIAAFPVGEDSTAPDDTIGSSLNDAPRRVTFRETHQVKLFRPA